MSATFALLLLASHTLTQMASGPSAGDAVPGLKVFAVAGQHENKEVDYAAERKDKPTIFVFVQAGHWDRPMARFLRELDQNIQKDHKDAYVVAIWLSEKPDDAKDYLPKAQESLKFEATGLTVFQGEKTGPDKWGINPDAHATVVITVGNKAAASLAYTSINDKDVDKVRKTLKKALEK